MHLRSIALQQFRNIPLATLRFEGPRQFFLGANGQGKTSLLEAIGFITALRSFRMAESRQLIAHGQPGAALACALTHERFGETTVTIKLGPAGREVFCDQERIIRLTDYLGRFPTVVFSSQDGQLIRGAPHLRRRFLDLALAAMDPEYLRVLQAYHRALAERNHLLKANGDPAELAAFERELIPAATRLIALRTAGLAELAPRVARAWTQIAAVPEAAGLHYVPDHAGTDPGGFAAMLEQNRVRDHLLKATQAGPHRDDFEFTLGGQPARHFASDGQQRSLVIALRLAQTAYFQAKTGVKPVLLADDVLGELDPERRTRFWATVDGSLQVLATGTRPPEDAGGGGWQTFAVQAGTFTEAPAIRTG